MVKGTMVPTLINQGTGHRTPDNVSSPVVVQKEYNLSNIAPGNGKISDQNFDFKSRFSITSFLVENKKIFKFLIST